MQMGKGFIYVYFSLLVINWNVKKETETHLESI